MATRDEVVRAAMEALTKRVVSAYQSPMNAMRWHCQLECGHEVWVTRERAPHRAACSVAGCVAHTHGDVS